MAGGEEFAGLPKIGALVWAWLPTWFPACPVALVVPGAGNVMLGNGLVVVVPVWIPGVVDMLPLEDMLPDEGMPSVPLVEALVEALTGALVEFRPVPGRVAVGAVTDPAGDAVAAVPIEEAGLVAAEPVALVPVAPEVEAADEVDEPVDWAFSPRVATRKAAVPQVRSLTFFFIGGCITLCRSAARGRDWPGTASITQTAFGCRRFVQSRTLGEMPTPAYDALLQRRCRPPQHFRRGGTGPARTQLCVRW